MEAPFQGAVLRLLGLLPCHLHLVAINYPVLVPNNPYVVPWREGDVVSDFAPEVPVRAQC
eukprot:scaffold665713_cov62-Prasinocladus_malaysianus.AAC.1